MSRGTINSKKHIIIPATIQNPTSGNNVDIRLIADTGSELTLVPSNKVTLNPPHVRTGRLVYTNFGPTYEIIGATLTVEVEDYGGGNPTNKQTPTFHVHYSTAFLPWADGLIGMDTFDQIEADPVKTKSGDAYLQTRY